MDNAQSFPRCWVNNSALTGSVSLITIYNETWHRLWVAHLSVAHISYVDIHGYFRLLSNRKLSSTPMFVHHNLMITFPVRPKVLKLTRKRIDRGKRSLNLRQ